MHNFSSIFSLNINGLVSKETVELRRYEARKFGFMTRTYQGLNVSFQFFTVANLLFNWESRTFEFGPEFKFELRIGVFSNGDNNRVTGLHNSYPRLITSSLWLERVCLLGICPFCMRPWGDLKISC